MNEHARVTTNHNEIRKWIIDHGGVPACTEGREPPRENVGVLRVLFEGQQVSEKLVRMEWDEFFTKFDQAHLAFFYEEDIPDGKKNNYYKFISRNGE